MTPAGPAPDEPLDFHAPAQPGTGAVTCAACKAVIADEYWTLGEAVLCGTCKGTVDSSQQVPAGLASRAGRLGRATLYGLGGMLAGAAVWYAVARFADLEVGLIAILLGWLVGKAVFLGSGKRGGLRYQVLAVLLTYLGIGVGYAPFAYEGMQEGRVADSAGTTTEGAAARTPEAEPGTAAPGTVPETEAMAEPGPAADRHAAAAPTPLGVGGFLLGLGAILVLILSLPAIVVIGGLPGTLISVLIYGFAIVQAWQLTRPARISFGGPFKVGGPATA